jgi:hypothetical protein
MPYPRRKDYDQLTKEEIDQILNLLNQGQDKTTIGEKLQVKTHAIRKIINTIEIDSSDVEKAQNKSQGLGDSLKKILHSKPLKGATEAIKQSLWKDEEDCGCEQRRETLNDIFRYKKKPNWLTKAEFEWLDEFNEKGNKNRLDRMQQKQIAQFHARVFNHKFILPCTCTPKRYAEFLGDLLRVYNEMKKEFKNG